MRATQVLTHKKPVIVKEHTYELAADGNTWMPTSKYVYVLYEDSSKKTVLTYRDTWVEIVACAKLAVTYPFAS